MRMERHTTKTIQSADGNFRVTIFRRDDGTFGFEHWKWGTPEQSWFVSGRFSECRVDTAHDAEMEARDRVGWLNEED